VERRLIGYELASLSMSKELEGEKEETHGLKTG
jgi:hypothetical protein